MPKGCMLSHDNLVWESYPLMTEVGKSDPSFLLHSNRVVSYLPLSHVAGLSVDVMGHIYGGHELYFARPDALTGTLVHTLTWAQPTIFLEFQEFGRNLKSVLRSWKVANLGSFSRC